MIMEVIDYNGNGKWSCEEILARYELYAAKLQISRRDLTPDEHSERGRRWIYPVMHKVIEGIEAGDAACVRLGIEFIEEDAKFVFGKSLKAKTARVLRRAKLSEDQKWRIRRRVFGMLQAGHIPHEYRDYAKLVRSIGFELKDVGDVPAGDRYVKAFHDYFVTAVGKLRRP